MALTPLTPLRYAPSPARADNLRGIAIMAFGLFLFSAVDVQAKYLTQSLHPIQIVWTRTLGLLAGVIILLALRGPGLLRTSHLPLQITRGVLAAMSGGLFIAAVAYVPLADAVAVSFMAPFFVTMLGALVLRETVGIRRWAAVATGFVGMLIVVRPGMGAVHPAMLLVLVAALFFALRQIISRMLAGSDRTETTVAYTAIVATALLSVPLLFVWRTPAWGIEMGVMFSMTVMAAVAEVCVIKALEIAQAVVVAPVQYSMLIWGTFYGWMVFGELPDGWTWLGALIIMATGIYTLHRERKIQRA